VYGDGSVLPTPLIFDQYWANSIFIDAGDAERESRHTEIHGLRAALGWGLEASPDKGERNCMAEKSLTLTVWSWR